MSNRRNSNHINTEEFVFNNPMLNNLLNNMQGNMNKQRELDIKEYMKNPEDLFKFLKEYSDIYKIAYIIEKLKKKGNLNELKKSSENKSSEKKSFLSFYKKKTDKELIIENAMLIKTKLQNLFNKYFKFNTTNRYEDIKKKQEMINNLINEYIYRLINKMTRNGVRIINIETKKLKNIKSINKSNLDILKLICEKLKILHEEYNFMHRDLKINDIKLLGNLIIFDIGKKSSIEYKGINIFCWSIEDVKEFMFSLDNNILHYEKFDPKLDINNLLQFSGKLKSNLTNTNTNMYNINTIIRKINLLHININSIYKGHNIKINKNNPIINNINKLPDSGITTYNPIQGAKNFNMSLLNHNNIKEALI